MNNNKAMNGGADPKILSQLISMASKKLGCTPEQLRSQLESGKLEQAIKNSSDPSFDKIKQAMNDPKAAEKIMNDPNTAELLKKLGKG